MIVDKPEVKLELRHLFKASESDSVYHKGQSKK